MARSESVAFAEIVNKDRMFGTKAFMPLCLKVCKLGCGSIEAPSRGEPKPGPLGPDFYFSKRKDLGRKKDIWKSLK